MGTEMTFKVEGLVTKVGDRRRYLKHVISEKSGGPVPSASPLCFDAPELLYNLEQVLVTLFRRLWGTKELAVFIN